LYLFTRPKATTVLPASAVPANPLLTSSGTLATSLAKLLTGGSSSTSSAAAQAAAAAAKAALNTEYSGNTSDSYNAYDSQSGNLLTPDGPTIASSTDDVFGNSITSPYYGLEPDPNKTAPTTLIPTDSYLSPSYSSGSTSLLTPSAPLAPVINTSSDIDDSDIGLDLGDDF